MTQSSQHRYGEWINYSPFVVLVVAAIIAYGHVAGCW